MREKQEGQLSFSEKRIIIAGRMGENDARRGKNRKDFSMTNKSWEYINSYNSGYDKVVSQKTNKRAVPKSLPPDAKRLKVTHYGTDERSAPRSITHPAKREEAPLMATGWPIKKEWKDEEEKVKPNPPATPFKRTGNAGQTIKNMLSYQKITIAGRTITVDAFLRRNYIFQDTNEKVSRRALYHAELFEDGTVTVNGRLVKWDTKSRSADISQLIRIGKETPITREAFLNRTYVFKDTGEVVNKKAQRAAKIHDDGTVTVNDRLIEWRRKKSTRRWINIGETDGKALTTTVQGDRSWAVNEKELIRERPFITEEHPPLFSGGYTVSKGLEIDELWRMLSSDYDNVPDSPGLNEFKREFMADIPFPSLSSEGMAQPLEGNHSESEQPKASDLNGMSLQVRKPYSPQFFSSLGKPEKISTTPQVFEPGMGLEGDKGHAPDRVMLHRSPACFTQQFVKAEKEEEEVSGCTLC